MIDDTSRTVRRRCTEADFQRWSKRLPVNAEYDELRGIELPPLLLAPDESVVGPCVTVRHPGTALAEAEQWETTDPGDVNATWSQIAAAVLWDFRWWLLGLFVISLVGWCAWIGWCEVLR